MGELEPDCTLAVCRRPVSRFGQKKGKSTAARGTKPSTPPGGASGRAQPVGNALATLSVHVVASPHAGFARGTGITGSGRAYCSSNRRNVELVSFLPEIYLSIYLSIYE